MKVSEEMKNVIKKYHKYSSEPWIAKTGMRYIGFGTPILEEDLKKVTKRTATTLFDKKIRAVQANLNRIFKTEIPQQHFDAFAGLAYEIGIKTFSKSSLYKEYVKGDFNKAAERILIWSKIKGIQTNALVYRRSVEFNIFVSGDYST